MNLKEHYLSLEEGLSAVKSIWHHNLLLASESALEDVEEFLEELACFSEQELYALIRLSLPSRASNTFRSRFEAICTKAYLPRWQGRVELGTQQIQGLNPKKIHEISTLLDYLKTLAQSSCYIDIGSGLGHLSRHLQWALQAQVVSLELQEALAKKAAVLSNKASWLDSSKLDHVCGRVPDVYEKIAHNLCQDTLSIGLHTCGSLAWEHLSLLDRKVSVVNFACCYDKLTKPDEELNRSRVAKQSPLSWSGEALFNLTRGAKLRSLEDFRLQKRVQLFRYAIQELLEAYYPEFDISSVGSASHYPSEFSSYCSERLKQLGLPKRRSSQSLDIFFKARATRYELMWRGFLLRETCLRSLEICIHLDRAMFFEEQGYHVELYEFFDRHISPRNIGMYVRPNSL